MNSAPPPIRQDLVLVGGGHAHLGVLRDLARHGVPAGTRVTLVAREAEALYSGMLPGLVAGRFAPEECVIDLLRIGVASGVRFVAAEVEGLDRRAGLLRLSGRPPLRYDVLSLNCGAAPASVPGVAEHALPLRPFGRFLAAWPSLLARASAGPPRLVVVGAGAGGVEVALALRQRLGAGVGITLVTRGDAALPRAAAGVQRRAAAALARAEVTLRPRTDVRRVEPGGLLCADGSRMGFDAAVWVADAAPQPWLQDSGLELCGRGFLAVDASLRCIGEEQIFAAGDCATTLDHPRPRAGVFAVRQGPPLAANLRHVLAGRAPRPFRPQRCHLALIATGPRHALAVRGGSAVEGRWALRLKDALDRHWIRMHAEMRGMAAGMAPSGEAAMRCGGCGAKLPAGVLARVLVRLRTVPGAEVPLGLDAPDDAALLRPPPPGRLLVQTADMFRAFTGDPWLFGRIAATHALGDIAAMGAQPRAALAIAVLPPAVDAILEADLFAMLAGAGAVLAEAGCNLVGGHSAEGFETMLGFALTGEVEEGRALRRSGLRAGDVLLLTKPLGTGAILAGQGRVAARHVGQALAAMQASPFPAARVLAAHGATACADVTGFGLLNHLGEMLEASGVGAVLDVPAIPALRRRWRPALRAHSPPRMPRRPRCVVVPAGTAWARPASRCCSTRRRPGDCVPAAAAQACLAALRAAGCAEAAVIGHIVAGAPRIAAQPRNSEPRRPGLQATHAEGETPCRARRAPSFWSRKAACAC